MADPAALVVGFDLDMTLIDTRPGFAATLSVLPAIPVAGMALILGVDRFMSECRSLTNFIGNAVATIVVARWEGAVDPAQLRQALGSKPST